MTSAMYELVAITCRSYRIAGGIVNLPAVYRASSADGILDKFDSSVAAVANYIEYLCVFFGNRLADIAGPCNVCVGSFWRFFLCPHIYQYEIALFNWRKPVFVRLIVWI